MPEVTIPHWVLGRFNLLAEGQQFQFGQSYKTDIDVTNNAQLDDFCTYVWSNTAPILQDLLSNVVQMISFTAETHYPQSFQYEGQYQPPTPVFGTSAASIAPLNSAIAVATHSGRRGRKYNGRYYLGGYAEGGVTGTQVTSGVMLLIADIASSFLASILVDDQTFVPAVASRAGGFLTEIAFVTLESLLDSQRRRLAGRGT